MKDSSIYIWLSNIENPSICLFRLLFILIIPQKWAIFDKVTLFTTFVTTCDLSFALSKMFLSTFFTLRPLSSFWLSTHKPLIFPLSSLKKLITTFLITTGMPIFSVWLKHFVQWICLNLGLFNSHFSLLCSNGPLHSFYVGNRTFLPHINISSQLWFKPL